MLGLIDSAKSDHYSLHRKLEFALDADSIAILINDTSQHLEAAKLIAELYLNTDNTTMAIHYYRMAAAIARKVSDNKNYGIAVNNIGTIFFEKSELDSALRYYTIANEIFRLNKDSLRYAQGLVNIGMIYKNLGKYDDAFRMALTGGKVLEKLNSTQDISDAYTTLGNILILMKNYQEALFYHQKALELRESINDSVGIAGSINNIGNVYRSNQKYIKALNYYRYALAIKERIGRIKAIATTIHNIAQVYVDLKQYSDAQVYFLKALSMREKVEDLAGLLETSLALSDLYLKTNDLVKAREYAAKVSDLLMSSGYTKQRLDQAISLINLYRQTGQFQLASEYANVALVLKDSIFYQNMAASIASMNATYQLAKKENENLVLKSDIALQKTEAENQRILFVVFAIFAVVIIIAISIVLRKNIQIGKQKLRLSIVNTQLAEFKAKSKLHNLATNFNKVNSLLKENKIDSAKQFTDKLGAYYNLSKESWGKETFTISDEIGILYSYCEVLKQYKNDITVKIFNDDNLHLDRIAFMNSIFDTLLDNSVNHGFRDKKGECVFIVRISLFSPDYLKIVIEDNGESSPIDSYISSKKTDRGLSILKKRIEDKCSIKRHEIKDVFSITAMGKSGTQVNIVYPLVYI